MTREFRLRGPKPVTSTLFATLALLVMMTTARAEALDGCELEGAKAQAAADALRASFEADQADRDNLDPKGPKNDAKRVKQVLKLDAKGGICSPESAYHAAWVLRRGDKVAHVQRAHELARIAMEGRIERGPWLSAVTYDRLQVASGHPQRFGTQLRTEEGRTCLFPVAADATDEERAKYRVQPLEDTFKRVLERNGLQAFPPERKTLDRNDLWCTLAPW